MSSLCLVTILLRKVELRTIRRDSGDSKWNSTDSPLEAKVANFTPLSLAYSLGIISPKSRMRNVRITDCTMKSTTALSITRNCVMK